MKLFGERRRARRTRLEIIPMIDVMFLLLVFYILSTAALVHQMTIPVDLPRAGTARPDALPEVTVTITRSGEIYLQRDRVEAADLAEAVQRLASMQPGGLQGLQERGVVLNADLEIRHRQLVQVMDILRQVGISRFAIATDPAAP